MLRGEERQVSVPVVEPVFGREGLRNYKEEPPAHQAKDQEELRQLLESLKSSDVISVQHKKGSVGGRGGQGEARAKPLLLNMEDSMQVGQADIDADIDGDSDSKAFLNISFAYFIVFLKPLL